MRSPDKILRHVVRCSFRCKHCGQTIGAENVSHYGAHLPDDMVRPSWFFASMMLLDHLRDCQQTDLSPKLSAEFGRDFLKHPKIQEWFFIHATVERRVVAEEDPLLDGGGAA